MKRSIVPAPARGAIPFPGPRSSGPAAAAPSQPGFRHDARWRLRRRDARLLASLGDTVLDDVGLTRADLQAVAGWGLSQRWWE